MNDARPTIVVLGSLNMDLVVRVERFPAAGETLLGAEFATFPGGKGANQAVAAARLGAHVRLIGSVGDDAYGRELVECARRADVDTRFIGVEPGTASGVAVITVDASGENRIVVAPGANARVGARTLELARSAFEGARAFVAQLETPLAAVLAGARAAREAGATTILNAAPARELAREELGAFDVLVVNRGEAATLLGAGSTGEIGDIRGDPATLARELATRGARTVVVTLGSEGVLAWTGERIERRAAFPVDVRDTTAAGDAFVGALACALAAGEPWSAVLARASAAGALACTRRGAQPSLPSADELQRFLASRV